MTGEIICVGSEILFGDIVNTNTQYLSQRLTDLGIFVYHQSVVGDYEKDLIEATEIALSRSDVIIFTGGLGPTSDDITKEIVSKVLGQSLQLDTDLAAGLKVFFESRGYRMTKNNLKQAMVPEGGHVLPNNNGTAPGIYWFFENRHIMVLPGPPREMKPMFEDVCVPKLKANLDRIIFSKTLKLIGIGESEASSRIQHIIDGSTNPIIAPYAKDSEVHFRITADGDQLETCQELVRVAENHIRAVLGEFIYTDDQQSLIEVVIDMLKSKQLTISLAESCTGGLLAASFVDVSGASEVFMEACISYSNEAKVRSLNVKEATLKEYGAVSKEVSCEMAEGIRLKTKTDIGIGITGIAGPGGGTEDKPVGLVHLCISIAGELYHYQMNLTGNRSKVRDNAAKKAIIHLYRLLKN